MKVICVASTLAGLPVRGRGSGTPESQYPLTPGRGYLVLGMVLWEDLLVFLVPDDSGRPLTAPAGLFELGGWAIPAGWAFRTFTGLRRESGPDLLGDPLTAAWGYPEYVESYECWNAVVDYDQATLAEFRMRVDSLERLEQLAAVRPSPHA